MRKIYLSQDLSEFKILKVNKRASYLEEDIQGLEVKVIDFNQGCKYKVPKGPCGESRKWLAMSNGAFGKEGNKVIKV